MSHLRRFPFPFLLGLLLQVPRAYSEDAAQTAEYAKLSGEELIARLQATESRLRAFYELYRRPVPAPGTTGGSEDSSKTSFCTR